MRHQHKGFKLSRTQAHRKATLAALSTALIRHKRIRTTLTKAKALRIYVEPLITRAKEDTTHNRRVVFSQLQDKHTVKELFGEVAAQVGDRPGGYTRIVKLGQRAGDAAEMALIELVDYNDVKPEGGSSSRRRTRRSGKSRRSTGSSKPAAATPAPAKETKTTTVTKTQSLAPDDEMEGVETTTVEEPVAESVPDRDYEETIVPTDVPDAAADEPTDDANGEEKAE